VKPILEIQNISKKYRIQHLAGGYLSLRERLVNALKFEKNQSEDFLALKDVSFEVQFGEAIAIIGTNGAGKSTLLKILSKITPPTSGRIISRGRIASLLEVGTGFHPELTGRENIFFNGSLLGMKRKEIESKFDEIVDFSGVEKFLDTPLKHYSSGMQLRLAFAVAAFLEPEILIIDEVLAVGDAEFQKKCFRKMEDVSKSGRTILFVSHDLAAVEKLCARTVCLQAGSITMMGDTHTVVSNYVNNNLRSTGPRELVSGVKIAEVTFGSGRIISNSGISFNVLIEHSDRKPVITEFCILIYTLRGNRVAIVDLRDHLDAFKHSANQILIGGSIKRLNLVEGDYNIGLHYCINDLVGEAHNIATITVADPNHASIRRYLPQYRGVMELDFKLGERND
jgi:lipopolysaccharide transport system ATP-binding protein